MDFLLFTVQTVRILSPSQLSPAQRGPTPVSFYRVNNLSALGRKQELEETSARLLNKEDIRRKQARADSSESPTRRPQS